MPDQPPSEVPSAPFAVVSGASSGIGWATVAQLRRAGFEVLAGARRLERLETRSPGRPAHAWPRST
jgi:NADP-dependent 3-hydroxy acid dehydrogenase YdfG